jgi:hypothetical protein
MTVHHPEPRVDVQDLLDRMTETSRTLTLALALLLAVGVAGFIAGILADPPRAWTALVWNWGLWSGIAVAGAVVSAAAHAANGRWIRPIRRLAEGLTAFLPASFLIMILLFFGLEHVYVWVEDPIPAKEAYLNRSFFVVRQAVGVAILYGAALAFVYWSLRPDVGRFRERVGGWRRDLYMRISSGWRGLDDEIERSHRVRDRLAPALIILYAILWTVWAWDWLMSVDPHWFSTLFGAWVFMTHFLAALGALAILACLVRPYRSFPTLIGPRTLHDLGKMVFAFTVFWTYLFFAQYLVIWYGRLPEETHFIEMRLWEAYQPIATIVFAAVFLVPFVGLLGVKPKRNPSTLTAFALVSLLGIWLLHFLLVTPSVFPDFVAFGWIEVAVALGVFALFALCYLGFLAAFPAVALAAGLPPDPDTETLAALTEPHHH